MVDCIEPFGRKGCRSEEVTWDFAMTAQAFGDVRSWLAIVFGLIKFGETEAICAGWGVGGKVGSNEEMGSEGGEAWSSLELILLVSRLVPKIGGLNYLRRSVLELVEGLDFQGIISGSIILSPWNKARFLIINLCSSRGV